MDHSPQPGRVDWQAVRREYRLGQLSKIQISKQFNIPVSRLYERAAREGWDQDLREVVLARTAERLSEAINPDWDSQVDLAAARAVEVVRSHLRLAHALHARLDNLMVQYDQAVVEMLDEGGEFANIPRIKRLMLMQSALEGMARTAQRITAVEMAAFGVGNGMAPATPTIMVKNAPDLGDDA